MNTLTKSFQDVTVAASAPDIIASLTQSDLFVYSPSSLERLGDIETSAQKINARQFDRNKDQIDARIPRDPFSRVIGFGGGTAIDTAKYIASTTDTELICIPAILSTNAYATNKVALYNEGLKVTLDAKLPDQIIFDEQTLCLSSSSLHRYGLADVASIHTALYDWQLAADAIGETINEEVYCQAQDLLFRLRCQVGHFDTESDMDLMAIYELIGQSGHITNLYGTGRPESGSEHIIAKALEHGHSIPHGKSISLSIVMASILQENQPRIMAGLIKSIGALSSNEPDLTREYVIGLLSHVQPRSDRYSIINEVNLDRSLAIEVVNRAFTLLGLE